MLELNLSEVFLSIATSILLSSIALSIWSIKTLYKTKVNQGIEEKKEQDQKIDNLEVKFDELKEEITKKSVYFHEQLNIIKSNIDIILPLLENLTSTEKRHFKHDKNNAQAIITTLKELGAKEIFKDKEFLAELVKLISQKNENRPCQY